MSKFEMMMMRILNEDDSEGEFREFNDEDESDWVIQFESDAKHSQRGCMRCADCSRLLPNPTR